MQDILITEVLPKYIDEFLEFYRSSNMSTNTMRIYSKAIDYFYQFFDLEFEKNEFLTLHDVNRYFLGNFVTYLKNNGLGDKTQSVYLTIIKRLLHFIADNELEEYKLLKTNISGIKVKFKEKASSSFTPGEISNILNLTAKLDASNKPSYLRNSLILKLLLFTGIRISELLNIKWNDIEDYIEEYRINITGKGDKQRYTYISKDKIEINIEQLRADSTSQYLINTRTGKQLNRNQAWSTVAGLLRKARVFKTGLHIFRHTLGQTLKNNNTNLEVIREVLGHSDIATTARIYAKANEADKRKTLIMNDYKTKIID